MTGRVGAHVLGFVETQKIWGLRGDKGEWLCAAAGLSLEPHWCGARTPCHHYPGTSEALSHPDTGTHPCLVTQPQHSQTQRQGGWGRCELVNGDTQGHGSDDTQGHGSGMRVAQGRGKPETRAENGTLPSSASALQRAACTMRTETGVRNNGTPRHGDALLPPHRCTCHACPLPRHHCSDKL